VNFRSRKKVILERQGKGSRENKGVKRRGEVIPERRTNRCKGPGVSHSCPHTRKKKIMAMKRAAKKRKKEASSST